MNRLITQTKAALIGMVTDVSHQISKINDNDLRDLQHESDSLRNNPREAYTTRVAAEVVYSCATVQLEEHEAYNQAHPVPRHIAGTTPDHNPIIESTGGTSVQPGPVGGA